MSECCETGEPRKKRYWHWIVLGCVVALAAWLQLSTPRYYHHGGSSTKAKADLAALRHALAEYAINNSGTFPCTLEPLVVPDADGHSYLEGYNNRLPRDPWKREYHYEVPTPAYPRPHVWSYGADGKRGGSGDDADIDSEDLLSEE